MICHSKNEGGISTSPNHATKTEAMNRKNNASKSTDLLIFPKDNAKCFFAVENEFQDFEKKFLQKQLRKRSNLVVASVESMGMIGIRFLMWFTKNIQGDMTPAGAALCHLIHCKLSMILDNREGFSNEEKNDIIDYVEKILK